MKSMKNIPASVRQRLLNRARSDRRPFNELLQYYAMERFLYRLSRSSHAHRYVLKGALMLRAWQASEIRPTMDIDLLGKTSNREADIKSQIRDILSIQVEDGLVFDADSITTERITEDADYEGIRVRFAGVLDSAKIYIQLDIGFGDIVFPKPDTLDLPTLLDAPPPRMLCYSRESSIAEKLQAMVKLGMLNSRMKDFYDIWLLSRMFNFDGPTLSKAIQLTFESRGTDIPAAIEAFTDPFIESKQTQWAAFWKRVQQNSEPISFKEIISHMDVFISPLISAILTPNAVPSSWIAPGPWT